MSIYHISIRSDVIRDMELEQNVELARKELDIATKELKTLLSDYFNDGLSVKAVRAIKRQEMAQLRLIDAIHMSKIWKS